MTFVSARRTTIREGRGADYARIHARIPDPVADALTACGVVSWHIWRDGLHLFHSIETVDGYSAMTAAIAARGPIAPEWDAVIADLLEAGADADVILPLVWKLDQGQQIPQ